MNHKNAKFQILSGHCNKSINQQLEEPKYIGPYLNENGTIIISMGIDSTSSPLITYITCKSDKHPPARGLGEKGPRKG